MPTTAPTILAEIAETGIIDGRNNYRWSVCRNGELYASGFQGVRADAERIVRSTKRFAKAGR